MFLLSFLIAVFHVFSILCFQFWIKYVLHVLHGNVLQKNNALHIAVDHNKIYW